MADSAGDAYVAGLTLLARRELSEAQLRQRLRRRGYSPDAVDAAIVRLSSERALDDARTAEAIARTALTLRGRGKRRALRAIQDAGIASETAARALNRAYDGVDLDELLVAALDKRLRGRGLIADRKEFQRLFRYLVGQGFEPERVLTVLNRRRGPASGEPDD